MDTCAIDSRPRVFEMTAERENDDPALLMAFASRGDRQALEKLFHRHAESAYRVARRVLHNPSDAEDAVQNAFMAVMANAGTFRFDRNSSVRSWIMGIVVNVSRNKNREEASRGERERRAAEDRSSSVSASVPDEELKALVVRAISGLPEHYRLPLWMHYLEGFSFQEIAETLAVSEGVARTQTSRGIEMLRDTMASAGRAYGAATLPALLASLGFEPAPPALLGALSQIAHGTIPAAPAEHTADRTSPKTSGAGTFAVALGVVAVLSLCAVIVLRQNDSPAQKLEESPKYEETKGESETRSLPASSASYPTPENPTGWRGNWKGTFPNYQPPVEWGRWCVEMKGLRFQAAKPKDAGPGTAPALDPPDYKITEWLVLDSVPAKAATDGLLAKDQEPDDQKRSAVNEPILTKILDEETIPSEAGITPDAGEKAGEAAWKAANVFEMTMQKPLPKGGSPPNRLEANEIGVYLQVPRGRVAYAHAYVYSDRDMSVSEVFGCGASKIWVNGKTVRQKLKYDLTPVSVSLTKGWNRILVKFFGGGLTQSFEPPQNLHYETKNVQWMAKLPQRGDQAANASSPVVVGDRIFLTYEPGDLVCYSRQDGKILWIRSNHYFEALTDDDKKALKEQGKTLDNCESQKAKLVETDKKLIEELNAVPRETYLQGMPREKHDALNKLCEDKGKLGDAVQGASVSLDSKRFGRPIQTWGVCNATVCSDGKRVYCWISNGMASCYDLDGNPIWKTYIRGAWCDDHGNHSSPVLVDGKFIVPKQQGYPPNRAPGAACLDAATGKVLWNIAGQEFRDLGDAFSLNAVKIGSEYFVVTYWAGGYRVSDGKRAWAYSQSGGRGCATPVIQDGCFYMHDEQGIYKYRLPDFTAGKTKPELVSHFKNKIPWGLWCITSPLYWEGLQYSQDSCANLTVSDMEAGKVLYTQELRDLRIRDGSRFFVGSSASPTLAGKYIYLADNSGVTLVVEPGREFRQVNKNVLQTRFNGPGNNFWYNQETAVLCWTFEGRNIFIRDAEYLYCIGETKP